MQGADIQTRQARRLQELLQRLLEPQVNVLDQSTPDTDLSPREIRTLIVLGKRGEMTMTDLAQALPAPLSTSTRVVDRLLRKQLVERLRHEQDRRVVVVKSTAASLALYGKLLHHQFEFARRMLAPLSSGEREILLELMGKMVGALPELAS